MDLAWSFKEIGEQNHFLNYKIDKMDRNPVDLSYLPLRQLSISEFKEEMKVDNILIGCVSGHSQLFWKFESKINGSQMGFFAKSIYKREDGVFCERKFLNGEVVHQPLEVSQLVFAEYSHDYQGNPVDSQKGTVWILQKRINDSSAKYIQSKWILLKELNQIKSDQDLSLFGKNAFPFEYGQLSYYCGVNKDNLYSIFQLPKKKGGFREISAPVDGLKAIQKCLNVFLQKRFTPHEAAMGFIPNKSVVDNANVHLRQRYVYNIDLKDFFTSITSGRIYSRLLVKPFSFQSEMASIITSLCCHKGVLPQGAPTSPTITNIICQRLDWRLSKLADRFNLKYSRYADDITFSGMTNIFHEDGEFVRLLHHYVEEVEGFTINKEKTRLNNPNQRQEVTGLTVNKKVNVSKKYIKQLRTLIHNWEKDGYKKAQATYLDHIDKDNQLKKHPGRLLENVIEGKLNYLQMVKGSDDSTFLSLKMRFDALQCGNDTVSRVLDIWEQFGIEDAQSLYQQLGTHRKHIRKVKIEKYELSVFEKEYNVTVSFENHYGRIRPLINGMSFINGHRLFCSRQFSIDQPKYVRQVFSRRGKMMWSISNKPF